MRLVQKQAQQAIKLLMIFHAHVHVVIYTWTKQCTRIRKASVLVLT